MFLRSTLRMKDGKTHRYFSVVENRRVTSGQVAQRTVLYLGEINDQQQQAWRKSIEVFDEEQGEGQLISLFPDDRPIPEDAVDSLQVKLSGLELRRPRAWQLLPWPVSCGMSWGWRSSVARGRELAPRCWSCWW